MNAAFDARQFRDAVGWFITGVTVITTRAADGTPVGVTANSFGSVSLDPPLVQFSLDRRALSLPAFRGFGHFAVSILAEDQQGLSARFAKPGGDKWRDIDFEMWGSGCAVLRGALAALDCRTEIVHEGGDHLVFIGRVLRLEARCQGRPLLFSRGAYHALGERLGLADTPAQRLRAGGEEAVLSGLEPWFAA